MSNTQHSAAELLPQLLNDDGVLNGEGSIAFTKPDRTTARLFLREGNIYAVDNLDYESNLWNQLKFEEHISHTNLRALIRAHKSQRDSLYKLLKRTRNKLKNEDSLVTTLREYILGAIDDIYCWESVKMEWRMGDTSPYDAAEVPPFHLSHALTLSANRHLFKFKKYEEWGFKNDDQFFYGEVTLTGDASKLETESRLEEIVQKSGKFVVKGLVENTGFSLFTVAATLDDLGKRISLTVENPAGRQQPTTLPLLPAEVPALKDTVHFSATDEDPDMAKLFNTEYHVPEPALLKEDDGDSSEEQVEENETFKSYDDVINDTSSLEVVEANLPPLQREKLEKTSNSRPVIPKEELEREEKANDIEQLYKSIQPEVPKARGVVRKPVAPAKAPSTSEKQEEVAKETVTPEKTSEKSEQTDSDDKENNADQTAETPTPQLEGKDMSDSALIALLGQVESELASQKGKIELYRRNISDKEAQLEAAKNEVTRITRELANDIQAKETAVTEFEKARKIIEALNS